MFNILRHLFLKKYHYDVFTYINSNGNPAGDEITGTIRVIAKDIIVEAWREKTAIDKAFEYINKKYPEYKGSARLF